MNQGPASILKPSPGRALVIDGRAASQALLAHIGEEARALIARGVTPGLSVVIVGEDPASQVYVRSKGRAASELGFHSEQHTLSGAVAEDELLALVHRLNADPTVDGILVQLPLPKHIRSARILEAIAPQKDVDGFHPINVGLAAIGETKRALIPCTPAGAMILIEKTGRHRSLEHRRQADRAIAAGAELYCDDRPFAHPRPRRRGAARRSSGGCCWPAGTRARRLDQARRDRHRRRRQPKRRRRTRRLGQAEDAARR
jgi:hypothetical protein